jgi:hypothetical protein
MRAFNGAPPAAPVPVRTGPTTISHASPPVVPAKDLPEESGHKRAPSATAARTTAPRRTSGGLTGQYSVSMPVSGGYFPNPDQQLDEAAMARKERQNQREAKRRALKAAWGTDNRACDVFFDRSVGKLTTRSRALRRLGRISWRRPC